LGYGWFANFRDPEGNVIGRWDDASADASHEGENQDDVAQRRQVRSW
jgi:hypothetical protein